MTCGIYAITNTTDQKKYLGSSTDIENRWEQHLQMLRTGKHVNLHLQRAWNRDGASAFVFAIIEEVEPEQLLDREQEFIDVDFENLYNMNPKTTRPPGRRWINDEIRQKLADAVRLAWAEGRKVGTPKSEETRKKMSETRSRLWNDPTTRQQMLDKRKAKRDDRQNKQTNDVSVEDNGSSSSPLA